MLKDSSVKGPSPRKVWLLNQLVVYIDNPDQIQKVLNSKYCIDKPHFYKGLIAEHGKQIKYFQNETRTTKVNK